jgi:hypothetical protein
MTVCLAALCRTEDGEPAAVVAADRMVTLGGFIEFEHAIAKMSHPTPFAVAMIAGDALVGTRLAMDVATGLNGTSPKTPQIASALATKYEDVRRDAIEHQILSPRGLDLATFYGNHNSLNSNIVGMVDQAMSQYQLGVELLLAGVDSDGAHIFTISNPGGQELLHDVIGYASTGSGAIHALQALIGFQHHAGEPLKETVFRAYAAKKRAEVAPGVGHDTDMRIITIAGITPLSSDTLAELETLYVGYEQATKNSLNLQLESIDLNSLTPHDDSGQPADDLENDVQ